MPSSVRVGIDLVLDVARPEGVLGLHGGDGVDGVGAADRRGARLGEPEVADLARGDELRHRAHGLLDGGRGVHAVLVVEVDVVGPEALERGVAGRAHVVRGAVDAALGRVVRVALDPELRGEEHLVAPALQGAADELLVRERAVHVGRVPEGDAELDGAVERPERLGLVAAAVEVRHAHAAEAEGGDGGALGPEGARVHALDGTTSGRALGCGACRSPAPSRRTACRPWPSCSRGSAPCSSGRRWPRRCSTTSARAARRSCASCSPRRSSSRSGGRTRGPTGGRSCAWPGSSASCSAG